MTGPPVKTPFGEISRPTAYALGGGIVLIGGIVWWRSRNAPVDANAAGTDVAIDPATGYAYGSAEDIAALGQQGNSSVAAPGGAASPYYPYNPVQPSAGTFTNNAQWSQAVVDYITGVDSNADAGTILAALGDYLAGKPLTTEEASIVHQATAAEGYPPQSGPNGYPPAINTAPKVSTPHDRTTPVTPGTNPGNLPYATGLKVTVTGRRTARMTWGVVGRPDYTIVYRNSQQIRVSGSTHSYSFQSLNSGPHNFGVQFVKNGRKSEPFMKHVNIP